MADTETAPKMERYLDYFEGYKINQTPTLFVEYAGDVDEEAFARAYQLLCERHPILRGRIHSDERGDLLYVRPAHDPALVACQGDAGTLRSIALDEDWDVASHVAQLILIRRPTGGFAAMRTCVAVADGTVQYAWMGELWYLYTAVVHGHKLLPAPAASLPRSPIELLRERSCLGMASIDYDELARRARKRGGPLREDDTSNVECIKQRILLSQEDTARLVAVARARKTTVNSLVGGACVIALHERMPTADPSPLLALANVDVRQRVSPPVAPTETTVMSLPVMAKLRVDDHPDPVTIGRDLRKQLTSWIASHNFTPQRHVDVIRHAVNGVIQINGVGLKPKFDHPDGVHITDMFVLASYNETIDPELSGKYLILTYDQQLAIECNYPRGRLPDGDATKVVERIKNIIGELIAD